MERTDESYDAEMMSRHVDIEREIGYLAFRFVVAHVIFNDQLDTSCHAIHDVARSRLIGAFCATRWSAIRLRRDEERHWQC